MGDFSFEPKAREKAVKPVMIVHGLHGLGKTQLASEAPNPIFIQTEDGAGELSLNTLKDGVFESYDEVMAGLRYLFKNPDSFDTLVLDSLDHLDPLVLEHTLTRLNLNALNEGSYGSAYQAFEDDWRKLINACIKLCTTHDKGFVGIAHSVIKTVNDPTTEQYDAYELKLSKKAKALWLEHANMIMFMNNPVVVDKKSGRAKGGTSVAGFVRPSAAYEAKTRYQKMPSMIPLPMGKSWDAVSQYIPAYENKETTNDG